jgi:hypothetical protein
LNLSASMGKLRTEVEEADWDGGIDAAKKSALAL